MVDVVFLDTGPLGLVTNPMQSPQSLACNQWLYKLLAKGAHVVVPEIVDYELRRELLRANKQRGIAKLDGLIKGLDYLPITTAAMRQAAEFWAQARQQGQPTSNDKTIDGDMILAGQAVTFGVDSFVIATTNVGHLTRFVAADLWTNL